VGAFVVTTVLAATAIASGAVYEIRANSGAAGGTDRVAAFIAGIPASRPAARLERERQNLILASASRTLSQVSTPKVATRPATSAPGSATPAGGAASGTPAAGTAPPASPPDAGTAQSIAYKMLPSFGFNAQTQFGCLDDIWSRESGWRYNAENASGAYGIPQALPGSKMASSGSDWLTNPATQINWGLGYIKGRYGTPCGAWAFWEGHGWY
jgi:hypothetical protein